MAKHRHRRKHTIKMARGVTLDEEAVTQKFGFIGQSGSGKTYAAGRLAEGLLDMGCQTCIIDPVGIWYGLRLKADGSEGFPISVLGGLRGDVALSDKSGARVAELLVEQQASVVLDVSTFSGGEQRRFMTDFAERLLTLKAARRTPLHIILEEAQTFLPQRVVKGGERMLGAWEKLCKLGRNFGVGYTLVTQRPQAVHKEVLNQTSCLFLMRSTGTHERKAICDWATDVGDAGESKVKYLNRELPTLATGEAYVWSPQWLGLKRKVKIYRKATMDTSATPKLGTKHKPVEPKPLSQWELEELAEALGTEAKPETETPVKKKKRGRPPVLTEARRDELLATIERKERDIDELHQKVGDLEWALDDARSSAARIEEILAEALEFLPTARDNAAFIRDRKVGTKPAESTPTTTPAPAPEPKVKAKAKVKAQTGSDAASQLSPKMVEIMQAMVMFKRDLTREQVAKIVGIKTTGSTFSAYLSGLNKLGFIEKQGKVLRLNTAGHAMLAQLEAFPEQPKTPQEVQTLWRSKLPGQKPKKIFDILLAAYPGWVAKESLAHKLGINSEGSTLSAYLSNLNRLGLIEKNGPNQLRAHTLLLDLEPDPAEVLE